MEDVLTSWKILENQQNVWSYNCRSTLVEQKAILEEKLFVWEASKRYKMAAMKMNQIARISQNKQFQVLKQFVLYDSSY